jgi:HSP20 family protein
MTQRWDPLRDLLLLQDRMNQVFTDATQQRARTKADADSEIEPSDWFPAADVYENADEYLVTIDLPGIERSGLDISLENNRLIVRGERFIEEQQDTRRLERPAGRFLRRFEVPGTVETELIAAEYKDGVLIIRLPKRREEKSQRVQIKVS